MVLRKARHFEVPLYGKVTTLKLKNAGKMEEVGIGFFWEVETSLGKSDGNSPAEEMIILYIILHDMGGKWSEALYIYIYIIRMFYRIYM